MSWKIIATTRFKKEVKRLIKKHRSLKVDLSNFVLDLSDNPIQGVDLGNNCRKIRLAITSTNKGKSGGARVIVLLVFEDKNVFLLTIFIKSETENLGPNDLEEMIKEVKNQ